MDNKEFEKLWVKATKRYKGVSHPEWGVTKEIAREMYNDGEKLWKSINIKSEYIENNFYINKKKLSECSICKTKVIAYYQRKEVICPICMIKLIEEQYKDKVKELQDWICKNNTIPFKDMFKDCEKVGLKLNITDGGWVNVIELNKEIKEIFG